MRYVIFDFPHNYNQTSREAVYQFFGDALHPRSPATKEAAYKKEADEDLRVFPDGKLPADAVTEPELIHQLMVDSVAQLKALQPDDKKSFAKYKETMRPLWKHTLQLGDSAKRDFEITFTPKNSRSRGIVVLADAKRKSAFVDENKNPRGLAKLLVERNFKVLLLDFPDVSEIKQNQADLFFTTYNRTFAQERVGDLVAACDWAKRGGGKVILCGIGRAGLWSLLAAPAADAVVADCGGADVSSDAELLKADLFIPGLRKFGGFANALPLAAPRPILLHHVAETFPIKSLREVFHSLRAEKSFRAESESVSTEEVADWISAIQ